MLTDTPLIERLTLTGHNIISKSFELGYINPLSQSVQAAISGNVKNSILSAKGLKRFW